MVKKSALVLLCALLLGPVGSALAGLDPDLVAWWAFDEGQGATAFDGSGNGNDGALTNGPSWVPGRLGTALQFNGTNTSVRAPFIPLDSRSFTIAMWINPVLSGSAIVFSQTQSSTANLNMHFRLGGPSSTDVTVRAARMGFYSNDLTTPGDLLKDNTWYHLTFWYDFAAQNRKIYIDGVQVAQGTSGPYLGTSGQTVIGSWASNQYYNGIIDDVQVYHRALSDADIQKIMTGLVDVSLAGDPSPEDEATDVPQDTVLSWTAGTTAAGHDVYFGTSLTDVANAARSNPMGVLAGQSQTAAEFDPEGLLEFGQTYYWRVDEVNGAPDNTIFKGEVWSFTAEPYAYPITGVTATASNAQLDMDPENVVDGSGLNEMDEHSIEAQDMWMTTGDKPAWIQFEFDAAYKLHEMWVWNSNQLIESFLGFGAKDVTIEYSTDGETWTTLEGAPQFAKATSLSTYTANTTVSFGGAMAKFIKLTIDTNWGGGVTQTGLSEVRFFQVPVQAREPQPVVAATGIDVNAELDWRPGRGATAHTVYFGTDASAVADGLAPAQTVADHGYSPADMAFATTYFWKVDEVGDAETYPGEVWSFTTQEFAPIDDMESYTDEEGSRIYEAWVDGLTNGLSGSTVGYMQAPFAERAIVHGGVQSMPMLYDNTASPYYAEAERTFATAQNWTTNGATTVSVSFQGVTPAFQETASGHILMNAIGSDIWGTADQFRFAYKTLTGNGTMIARVNSVYNSNVWAKAGVMIRQNTNAGSVHAFMPMTPGGASAGNGASFQRRLVADAASTSENSTTVVAAPYWVKIERIGDSFSAYISPDGATWTRVGTPQTIPMTGPVLIGLALCSHVTTALTGADFSDVATTGNVTDAWEVAEIGAAQREGNSPEGLYLTVKDNAGKTATIVNPDALATGRMGWQQWLIPLSDLTSAGLKTTAMKSVTVGVGNRTSPSMGGAGTIYIDDIGYGVPLP